MVFKIPYFQTHAEVVLGFTRRRKRYRLDDTISFIKNMQSHVQEQLQADQFYFLHWPCSIASFLPQTEMEYFLNFLQLTEVHVRSILVHLEKNERQFFRTNLDFGTLNLGSPMRHAHSTTLAPARSGKSKEFQQSWSQYETGSSIACNSPHKQHFFLIW